MKHKWAVKGQLEKALENREYRKRFEADYEVFNPDFALGVRTETNEALPTAETFPTKKVRAIWDIGRTF